MNFIFISPNFPRTYWNFCDRLKRNGVNVLGIGDEPYDSISEKLKKSVNEYYVVNSLENYDEVFRAVAFFSFKYGKIDWIESNNEYWLRLDAKLRDDFNVKTGFSLGEIACLQSKIHMKELYDRAGVPAPRSIKIINRAEVEDFISLVGYPVIIKPEIGVGASHTYKINNSSDLDIFFDREEYGDYMAQEYVEGDIVSYDAVISSEGEPLFESVTHWPKVLDVVNNCLDFYYYVAGSVDEKLKEYGRRTVKEFGVRSRFVHLEFFKLTEDKCGLGKKGDYIALEANLRVAGGYTPDIMNFAHSIDVYRIWADMVTTDRRFVSEGDREYYCVYVSRRDRYLYKYSLEEVKDKFRMNILVCERAPEVLSDDMGNQFYIAKFDTLKEVENFADFVLKKE